MSIAEKSVLPTKLLIVNADDFGYSSAVNTAISRAHTQGILTSASLMVAEAGWQEAVEIARRTPTLGIGLHAVVTYDRALLPHAAIPHLVDATGKFSADPLRVGLKYAFSKTARVELKHELTAQFARFAETGLSWSHVDGHQHFHMHPAVWDILLDLCDEYGVHRLRVPHEELRIHLRQGGDGFNTNTAATLALRVMRRRNLRVLRDRETLGGRIPFVCERVYGQLQTGNMNEAHTLDLLNRITGCTNEIYFHPGAPHARSLPQPDQRDGVADVELKALLAKAVRERLHERGIRTGTYADIEAASKLDEK